MVLTRESHAFVLFTFALNVVPARALPCVCFICVSARVWVNMCVRACMPDCSSLRECVCRCVCVCVGRESLFGMF